MIDAGRHPRIELMAYSEVVNVSGYIGNFTVQVKKKARYVNEKECTACGDCVAVCPVTRPDEYQAGFSTRKAICIPFPQAIPASYLINMDDCLGTNPIACGKCADVCEKKCIDFDMQDKIVELKVGAVVVATGMEVYDPTEIEEYGYGRYPNVITSIEFERLICAGGPTEGHFVRPSDEKRPTRIGFVQCVGSRSSKYGHPYCSNICCMNTVKDTLLLRDHYPDTQCSVFYMDMRAFGKSFEDFYMRSKEEGVRYIRSLPGEIEEDPETHNLRVVVESGNNGSGVDFHEFDMVVLSTGVIPRGDSPVIRKLFTLSKTSDGFLMEAHPRLKPVDAPTRGVFMAGCAESPKDIKDSVAQAGAAASHANILLNAGQISIEAITSVINEEICNGCELCLRVCPYHAIQSTGKQSPPTIVTAACAGCGNCGAACPTGAITMRHFTDTQIEAQVDATTSTPTARRWYASTGSGTRWRSSVSVPTGCSSNGSPPPRARSSPRSCVTSRRCVRKSRAKKSTRPCASSTKRKKRSRRRSWPRKPSSRPPALQPECQVSRLAPHPEGGPKVGRLMNESRQ
jgi:heterodisulfide reductase subunit A